MNVKNIFPKDKKVTDFSIKKHKKYQLRRPH